MDFNFSDIKKGAVNSIPDNMIKVSKGTISMPASFVKDFAKFPRPRLRGKDGDRHPLSSFEVIHLNVAYDKQNHAIRLTEGNITEGFAAAIWTKNGLASLPIPRKLWRTGLERGWYQAVDNMKGVFKLQENTNV